MKTLTPNHRYELSNHEHPSLPGQVIQFIEKEPAVGADGKPAFVTVSDGTTNEEVLVMLIDRMRGLIAKLPSRETAIAITKCQEALMWLEQRTKDRTARKVENTPMP